MTASSLRSDMQWLYGVIADSYLKVSTLPIVVGR